jgi:hypothetical protein
MGTVAVLEKGTGLDKAVSRFTYHIHTYPHTTYPHTYYPNYEKKKFNNNPTSPTSPNYRTLPLPQLWRLPALLVEDFDEVTPSLLETAYVEALYRSNEFEFNRLTQSFWYTLVMNVSSSMSSQPLLDLFPPESEDPTFTLPKKRFDCWLTNSCGVGTKRISKTFCVGDPGDKY